MFDIGSSELLVIAVVALIVIGPKDLPRVLHQIGKWIAKARAMTGHVRAGLETMAREAELEDMEKQWAAHNDRIMAEHPHAGTFDDAMMPLADPPPLPSTGSSADQVADAAGPPEELSAKPSATEPT